MLFAGRYRQNGRNVLIDQTPSVRRQRHAPRCTRGIGLLAAAAIPVAVVGPVNMLAERFTREPD
jgi:hypothetical protein